MKLRHAMLPLSLLLLVPSLTFAARGFEVRDLVQLERVSSPKLSPDGSRLVYSVREADLAANKSSMALWTQDLRAEGAAKPVRLTATGWSVNTPAFARDGKTVYFLSAKSGSQQLYAIPAGGGTARQVTDLPADVGGYSLSPDGARVALVVEAFADCGSDLACGKKRLDAKAANKATGQVFDRMFIRHWDAWNGGQLNRIFVAPLDGKAALKAATLVAADVLGDVPSRPFGDTSEFAWSPDGKSFVVSARKADRVEPWSTNFDLYEVRADGTGAARNLTAGNPAWDTGPVFSADGKTLYYRAMRRPGNEADRLALMAMDLVSGSRREIAPKWDRSADGIVLSADGRTIYTLAQDTGDHPLFAIDIATGAARRVAGDGTIAEFDIQNGKLAFTRNTLKGGDQIFVGGVDGAALRQLTFNNADRLKDVAFGDAEQFTFRGWNNDIVHGYIVKPWNYQPGRKYAVAFLIHGGPQGSFGNNFHYRWNPQTYAGQGYAVVMVDFHGSTGYGQKFTDSISQHWGDRPLEDLQKGWKAALAKYEFLDGNRACALGASYGGYMVNWIAGNWPQPWKCLVNHDGIFDQRMFAYATEEQWFSDWENGGTPYDVPRNYEKFNPVNHVHKWRVPMLVIHGQLDYRIPVEQGIAAFTALQRKGIESKFLYFPDENHFVLKPQNSVLWHDTVNAWLKRHIGG